MKLLKLDLNNFKSNLGDIEKNDTTKLEIKLLENIDYKDYNFRLIAKIDNTYKESILDTNNSNLEDNILSINLDKKFIGAKGLVRLELNMCKDNLESTSKEFYFCISNTFNADIISKINDVDTLKQLEKYIDYSKEEIEKIKLELENISLDKLIEIRDNLILENKNADKNINLLDSKNKLAIDNLSLLDAKNLLATQNIEDLETTIVNSNISKENLIGTITTANTSKINLENTVKTATTSKSSLDLSINSANASKTNLDDSISNSSNSKNNLDTSITNANNKKKELDASITNANVKINALDSKNAEATSNISNLVSKNAEAVEKTTILTNKIVEAEAKKVEIEEIIEMNVMDFGEF